MTRRALSLPTPQSIPSGARAICQIRRFVSSYAPLRNPTTASPPVARAASGHVAAVPPRRVMNARRFMCGWPPPGKRKCSVPHRSGARPVFNDERLTKSLRQPLPDQARDDVGRAGGAERHDHAHRPRPPGKRTVNTDPLPGSLVTVTSPPILRASLREMARPRPVPP
jgi:hypothetical protein